jgi:hypothetical protein
MNIFDIAKKVGSSIVKAVVPGGGMIIDLVNEFLPSGEKLPATATGDDIKSAAETLPPDQRAKLFAKELDVEITESNNWREIQRSFADADSSGSSNRPKISNKMANLIIFADAGLILCLFRGVWMDTIKLEDCTMLVASILSVPATIVLSYFGKRFREKKARYAGITGQPTNSGGLAGLVKMFRG